MGWISMHGFHRATQLSVCEGEQPSDTTLRTALEMQAYRLNQHHVSQVLCDQQAAWPLRM